MHVTCWYMLPYGWTLKTLHKVNEASHTHTNTHIAWFYFYQVSRKRKSIEILVAKGWRDGWWTGNDYFFLRWWDFLKLYNSNDSHEYTKKKTIELHSLFNLFTFLAMPAACGSSVTGRDNTRSLTYWATRKLQNCTV